MLFNRTVTIQGKKYNVKKYLSDNETFNLIDSVIDALFIDDEFNAPLKNYAIYRLAITAYTGCVFDEKSEIDNTYLVFKQIESRFDKNQFSDILDAIDNGIQYRIGKLNSMFGDTEKMMNELQGIVDKIGIDKIGDIIGIGEREEAVKQAHEKLKSERNEKKITKIK
jgi:hypothetical protein